MKNIDVYTKPFDYAAAHNEAEKYNKSFTANIACKEAIETAVDANYADNRLNTKAAARQVLDQFGADRVAYVLAVTIKAKDYDGRISPANKAWAQTISTADDKNNRYLIVDKCNPGLTDLFAKQFRTELQEHKPSVLEKLTAQSARTSPQLASKLKNMER